MFFQSDRISGFVIMIHTVGMNWLTGVDEEFSKNIYISIIIVAFLGQEGIK